MNIVEAKFKINNHEHGDKILELINSLLGSYRSNGQILGQEFAIFQQNQEYITYLKLPDIDSLKKAYNNKYIAQNFEKLSNIGLEKPIFTILGEDAESASLCNCDTPKSYVLFTSYLCLESPLRCFDCFGTIPLYRIPKTYEEEYYDIICWQNDYQSCDRLQINCKVGETFAMNQMFKLNSALTKQGLKICRKISKITQKDTYYYLYKGKSRGIKFEQARVCPSCQEQWLLEQGIHGMFDFMCQKCLLLSNISWDVR